MLSTGGKVLVITRTFGFEVSSYASRLEAAKALLTEHINIERMEQLPAKKEGETPQADYINHIITEVGCEVLAYLQGSKIRKKKPPVVGFNG